MQGQPPIFWDRAEGFSVHDRWGNRWIDWTSAVLVGTNAGHSAPRVVEAIREQAAKSLLTNFCFANEPRLALAEKLCALAPPPLEKVFPIHDGVGNDRVCRKAVPHTGYPRLAAPRKSRSFRFRTLFTAEPSGRSKPEASLRSRTGS